MIAYLGSFFKQTPNERKQWGALRVTHWHSAHDAFFDRMLIVTISKSEVEIQQALLGRLYPRLGLIPELWRIL